ncbi:MAG: HAD-IA family hydrolase [Anaerolineae bacterium]|nr:HAD-IA family hydrolase [Anaerolineae bacterium]
MVKYRNLIWDLDGTLFDTYPAFVQSFAAVCTDLGKPIPPEHITRLVRVNLNHCAAALAEEFDTSVHEIESRFGAYYSAITPQQQAPFPGVRDVCEYILNRGGTHVIITHRRRETTLKLLQVHDLTRYFADSFTADDGFPPKPDPAAFIAMINKHGFDPQITLGIGDRAIDTLAAQAAGLCTCLYGNDGGDAVPTVNVGTYAELLGWLKVADA